MVIFVLSFTIVNISLWVILLIRFKKLFSTDSIIERTRAQMNQMVSDIDKATDRNMFLVKESEKRLKEELAEADKKMELFREATDRLRDMIAEADRINKISNKSQSLYQDFNKTSFAAGLNSKKAVSSYLKEKNRPISSNIDPDSSYELNSQGELFSSSQESSILKNETNVTQDGAAFREVPLIITKVLDETSSEPENNSLSSKSLSEQVKILFEQGYKAEEIAAQLSCSITEVQFIIDMI
ncbi:MAG: hypothetical protein K5829_07180 [Treponema sp.]|nr:hypothetical protein [Treponema sp.]